MFQFSSGTQFGGMGTGASLFGPSSMGGAGMGMGGASDDPYANIAIDLTKVKKSEPPAKPFEMKTEEEKKKELEKKKETAAGDKDKDGKSGGASSGTNANAKSNLKKEFEKEEETKNGRKRSVTFGGATKYEFTGEDESGEYNK